MKKFYLLTKTLLVATILLVGGANSAWAQSAGTYYIQNVGTGKWLSPGNSWETQASVLNHADKWVLAGSEGTYTLESVVSNGSGKIYLNGGYCDGTTNSLTFTAIGGKTNTYSIKEGTKYYTTDGTTASATADNASSDNAQWKLYSASDLTTAMASATPASGVDATWLILDHNLSRNNRNYSSWSNTGATEPKTSDKTESASSRYSIEAFQKTFDVHQALTSIPNGVYGVQVNGFYRQDGSNTNLPYVYAGSNKTTIQSRGSGTENTMQAAAESFVAGSYLSNRAAALVTDGNLTVGVGTEGTSCWTIFKNFHLTYYGNPTVANPLDMTSWIVNPDIEVDGEGTGSTYQRNATGWSHNNTDDNYRPLALPNGSIDNTSGAFTNSYCFELYRGGGLSGKKVYQTITGLPNGVYKVQLAAFVNGDASNEFVYASSNGTTYMKTLDAEASNTKLYDVYAIVSNGVLEIGLDLNTSTRTWACIDNAHLYYYGDSEEARALVTSSSISNITSLPATYSFNTEESVNTIFDKGVMAHGTNVWALRFGSGENPATAYFDTDVVTTGKQAYEIGVNETVEFTINALHGYYGTATGRTYTADISIKNSSDVVLASYSYDTRDGNIYDVKIGGTTVDNFESLNSFYSIYSTNNANGLIANANKPYVNTANNNPVITISISGAGNVKLLFTRGYGSISKEYTGTLPNNVAKDLAKIVVADAINNTDRAYCIQAIDIKKYFNYTIKAVDESSAELTTLDSGLANSDGSTTKFWNKYIKVDGKWYETASPYGKNITTADNTVTYTLSDIDYFVEAEAMTASRTYGSYATDTYYSNGGGTGLYGDATLSSNSAVVLQGGSYTVSTLGIIRSTSQSIKYGISYSTDGSAWTDTEKTISYTTGSTSGVAEYKSVNEVTFPDNAYVRLTEMTKSNAHNYLDLITLTRSQVAYKVKYMCGETEIKTADDSRTAKWGTTVALTDEDKDNIIYNNATYQYSSDNASSTVIAADGSSVITVNFTQVPFYTQTNVTGAETWDWTKTTSGTAYIELTNETTPVKDTEFVLKNVELYGKAGSAYSVPTDFGDAQKLSVKGQYPFRYYSSKGMFQGNTVKFTTEVPGILTVDFSRTADGAARTLYVNGEATSFTTTSTEEVNATGIVVQAGDVEITGNEGGSLAYLRIYKITFTPVTSVSATISSYGWATFSSDYALDFSKATAGLEAYMITGHEGTVVTKSKVEGTIPASTGLLLKGDAGNYTIPVVASSSTDVSANKLVAGTGAPVSAVVGNTRYVLGISAGDEAEFQKITETPATVAKGKAYLEFVGESLARSMSFEDGKITGVENVEAAPAEATLKEGKFIEDGKLVIFMKGMKFNANGQLIK